MPKYIIHQSEVHDVQYIIEAENAAEAYLKLGKQNNGYCCGRDLKVSETGMLISKIGIGIVSSLLENRIITKKQIILPRIRSFYSSPKACDGKEQT